MKQKILLTAAIAAALALTACSDQKKESDAPTSGVMKCGAGKCGANMVSGDSALADKQRNILSQMDINDPRMKCVMDAKSVEAVYDCVRDPETGKLSLEYTPSK